MRKIVLATLLSAPLTVNASEFDDTALALSGQLQFGAAGQAPALQVGLSTVQYAPALNRQLPMLGLAWRSGQALTPTLLGAPLSAATAGLNSNHEGGVGDTIVKTTTVLAVAGVAIVALALSQAGDIFGGGDDSRSGGSNNGGETQCGVSGDVIGPNDPDVNGDCFDS